MGKVGESVPEIIDVLVAIDADTVVTRHGGNDATQVAVKIDDDLIRVLAPREHAYVTQNGSVRISTNAGDAIRWRGVSLSDNTVSAVVICSVEVGDSADMRALVVDDTELPVLDPKNPLEPTRETGIRSYFHQCLATKTEPDYYSIEFLVLDENGKRLGYYRWSPPVAG